MGVTPGELAATESQTLTITIPGPLTAEQAARLEASLEELLETFNERFRSAGKPALSVVSCTVDPWP